MIELMEQENEEKTEKEGGGYRNGFILIFVNSWWCYHLVTFIKSFWNLIWTMIEVVVEVMKETVEMMVLGLDKFWIISREKN